MTIRHTIVLCVLLLTGCASKPPQTATPSPAENNVAVDPLTERELEIETRPAAPSAAQSPVTATGRFQSNADRTWSIGAVIEGRIVAVPVNLGDNVKAGQVVAQMHGHAVYDARADRRQAVAQLERLKVLAEQALRVRDRTRRIYALKAASREQLEAAETEYRSAQLNVANAEAEVQKAETHLTDFLEVPSRDPAPADANVADRVPIKAPASGTVMERSANVGSVVSVGHPVVTISDLSTLWLIAAVNEADLPAIRRGQSVKVMVRAYGDRVFPGTVTQLGERLDAETRTLQVRVLVPNPGGLLKPEMFATAQFPAPAQRPSLYVPESAVQDWNGKTVVFVRKADNSFEPRPVETGAHVSGQIEIRSGIDPGALVVVNGAIILKSQLAKGSED